MKKIKLILAALVLVLTVGSVQATEMSSTNYSINPDTMGSGGGKTTSTNYKVSGMLGQAISKTTEGPNNTLFAGFWNESTIGIIAPTGEITIGSGSGFIGDLNQTIYFSATDSNGSVSEMRYTEDGSLDDEPWLSYVASVDHTFTDTSEGLKEILVQYKDNDGNQSQIFSDSAFYDITPPTEGSLSVSAVSGGATIVWSGFTDTGGIITYKLLADTSSTPADCLSRTILYNGSSASYSQIAASGDTYYYRLCATDENGNTTAGLISSATIPQASLGLTFSGVDTGLQGISKSNGDNDSTNIDNDTGNPSLDANFTFQSLYRTDTGEGDPQSVKVYITNRTGAGADDYYGYDLSCTGSFGQGAMCIADLQLGPAQTYLYYFEVVQADSTVVTLGSIGSPYTGPTVELLTGYSMLSIARNIDSANLDGDATFGDPSVYRWISNGINNNGSPDGAFLELSSAADPVKGSEGYFVWKNLDTLNNVIPELGGYSDNTLSTYTITLVPGWNIVGTPYGKHTLLSNLTVQKDSDAPITWDEAVSGSIVANAIYYYQGSDWGSTYEFSTTDSSPPASLAPWLGYWIYLSKNDGTYKLIIPRP